LKYGAGEGWGFGQFVGKIKKSYLRTKSKEYPTYNENKKGLLNW
jgi:hypothetical protein